MSIPLTPRIRVIALYLPQYHPIPENDAWWGAGFTEWTNTAKAKPLFRGHYQPHVPADLGFYDLRLPEARAAQAAMAAAHGIEGFCYYHYWFGGKRLIERPFLEVLRSGQPDFPFCLCWANQSWTGVWHGAPNRMLIEQTYPGMDDHARHFEEALLPALLDPRYIRIEGKPLVCIFKPQELPDAPAVLAMWRERAQRNGLPGLFVAGEHDVTSWNPTTLGFDAVVSVRLPPKRRQWVPWSQPIKKIGNRINQLRGLPSIASYERLLEYMIADPVDGIESYPCVVPNWDNTPRSGVNGRVLLGSTPELFRQQVRRAVARVQAYPVERRIVFVKSWNEWAEGNHLEPDLKFGRGYLRALRDELAMADAHDVSK